MHNREMAGGMSTKRDGLSLADRRDLVGVTGPPPAARHCWVFGLPDAPGRWPGLLVEWRKTDRWLARVVYAIDDGQQTILIEAWVAAEHLEPVGSAK